MEQIVENTHFLAELHGSPEELRKVAERLAAVLEGRRWLRLGRAGSPVEVARFAWSKVPAATKTADKALLTLTSDLLVRDEKLRWVTKLSQEHHPVEIKALFGDEVQLDWELQDHAMVHGFNGTSRLWRMPAAAIRRGSVFEVSGKGVAMLAARAARNEWLGERTHEGFGRFRVDFITSLPGVTSETPTSIAPTPSADITEESIAARTQEWFNSHKSLAKPGGSSAPKPSLSQWLDFVTDVERGDANAISSRLNPTTVGGRSWRHEDAKSILNKLNDKALDSMQRVLHARLFVRWLRAEMRKNMKEGR